MAFSTVATSKVQSSDSDVNQLQNNIILSLSQIQTQLGNTPGNGVFVTTPLKSGANIINHSLGVIPKGYIVTDIDAATTIYRVSYAKATITLNSSSPANAIIFLF